MTARGELTTMFRVGYDRSWRTHPRASDKLSMDKLSIEKFFMDKILTDELFADELSLDKVFMSELSMDKLFKYPTNFLSKQ